MTTMTTIAGRSAEATTTMGSGSTGGTMTIGTGTATVTTMTATRMRRVPRPPYFLLTRRLGWWGIALTAWDLWRRIPKKHRKRMLAELRQHAPGVARGLTREARRMRDTARAAARSADEP
jgi:hypothetical protein